MGNNPDAGYRRWNVSITAGDRGIENKSTENKGLDLRTNTINKKGLWLFSADNSIGLFSDNKEWKVEKIFTGAGPREGSVNGFAPIIEKVKNYYESSGKKQIPKLAIVVHGDAKGLVQIANLKKNIPKIKTQDTKYYDYMSPYSIRNFEKEIKELNKYLTKDAQVIFHSCLTGAGEEGSYLLKSISSYLSGKTVIAFTTIGESGRGYNLSPAENKPAGRIYETGESFPSYQKEKLPLREINSQYAKQALNGKVIVGEDVQSSWRPEEISYISKNLFTILGQMNKHIYYFGVMLNGWAQLEKHGYGDQNDYRIGKKIIENDEEYIKYRDQDLPKPVKMPDTDVWIVYKAYVQEKLDEQQKKKYQELKATLAQYYQNKIPAIWTGFDKKQTFAIVDAMLQLSSHKRVDRSIISTIGESSFYTIFKK